MPKLGDNEKANIRQWLGDAYHAAMTFDGSERSENALFEPLTLFEDFARAHGQHSATRERRLIEVAFSDHPPDMPMTISDLLGHASGFYERLRSASRPGDLLATLARGGAVVKTSEHVFVQTERGAIHAAQANTPNRYEVETEPRLAILIAHLRNDGVNGQSIYTDDLVITRGAVAGNMMRIHPYHIVQIPRLDIDIAVCDQINETTFIKRGTTGPEFWAHMSKDELKVRDDIRHVDRHSDEQWWADIASFLSGQHEWLSSKVDIQAWVKSKPNLDLDMVKQSLLAHRLATGEWLSASTRSDPDGTSGSYVLEHGPYAGQITSATLDSCLSKGIRGLPGGSSMAALNADISRAQSLDYVNKWAQPDLDLSRITQSLLAHRMATGEWLSSYKKGQDDARGSYMLEHGPYAGMIRVRTLEVHLITGGRGLPGGSSIAQINEELSKEHDLDYVNKLKQPPLDLALIKEGLLAHRLATGEWLTGHKRQGPDGTSGSYVLEHGPYAGEFSAIALDLALSRGYRGLPGESSIAKFNEELSREHGLDYVNVNAQPALDLELIKQSLLAHRLATGEWLQRSQKGADGETGSYVLEHGPYAGHITAGTLGRYLIRGSRGLPGGSSIAKLNHELRNHPALKEVPETTTDEPSLDLHA